MAIEKSIGRKAPAKKASVAAPRKKADAPTLRQTKKMTGPKVPTRTTSRIPADDPLSAQRVTYLSEVFSGTRLAKLIGVSPSQTSRWASGTERPSPAAAPALIDLEHVYARARLVWGGDTARIWLESANAFLGGARPIDVLITEGPMRVLEALDAEMWGGAA